MTRITKTIISTIALLSVATTAQAGESTFDTRFNFDKSASIEANYNNFEATAKEACRAEIKRVERLEGRLPLSDKNRFNNSCQRQLMDRVVSATKVSVFIAYHDTKTSKLG